MEKIRLPVDFNEMIDSNTIMLSQSDTKTDWRGRAITLSEGLSVCIYEEAIYDDGTVDYLIAEGTVTRHDLESYPFYPHVKWLCHVHSNGIQNRPELSEKYAPKEELK